jgi:hypothetical protein
MSLALNINIIPHRPDKTQRDEKYEKCSNDYSSNSFLWKQDVHRLYPSPNFIRGIKSRFTGSKARPGRDARHSPHLVPRPIMSRSYISSTLKRLHGM